MNSIPGQGTKLPHAEKAQPKKKKKAKSSISNHVIFQLKNHPAVSHYTQYPDSLTLLYRTYTIEPLASPPISFLSILLANFVLNHTWRVFISQMLQSHFYLKAFALDVPSYGILLSRIFNKAFSLN